MIDTESVNGIDAEHPVKKLLTKGMVAWILTPTAIGILLLAAIALISRERTIRHPQGAIAREYWPTEVWKKAPPSEKGMDAFYLEQASKEIKAQHPAFVSFLVVRDGYLVWERYFGGRTNFTSNNNLHSASKSVLSTLVGIALDDGLIDDVQQPISDFFPEYFEAHPGSEKAFMTVQDLLTMRSGIEWLEEAPITLIDPRKSLTHQILDLPSSYPPGETFNYSSADSHLLSAILTKATGESALEFADERLFGPLGIRNRNWRQDRQGVNYGGTGLYLKSRDLAAIGLLYLNQGYWEGEQILSQDWIAEATYPHVTLRDTGETAGLPAVEYGYQWWVRKQGTYESYMALGYAGQYIIVIPELDLVVVITSIEQPWISPDEMSDTNLIDLELLEQYVIPSVIDPAN